MIRPLAFAPLLLLVGCAGVRPQTTSAPASPGSLDCALAEVTGLGYTVEAAAPDVFFKAERARNALAYDVLNASVAGGTLRVAASMEVRDEDGRRPQGPSRSARSDAESVVGRCGAGA